MSEEDDGEVAPRTNVFHDATSGLALRTLLVDDGVPVTQWDVETQGRSHDAHEGESYAKR